MHIKLFNENQNFISQYQRQVLLITETEHGTELRTELYVHLEQICNRVALK